MGRRKYSEKGETFSFSILRKGFPGKIIRFRVNVRTRIVRPRESSVRVTFVLGRRLFPAGSDLKRSGESGGVD